MELVDDAGLDPLGTLEERIRRAVSMIPQLREERDNAVRERNAAVEEAEQARSQMDELLREVESLREEREQLKGRIESCSATWTCWPLSEAPEPGLL